MSNNLHLKTANNTLMLHSHLFSLQLSLYQKPIRSYFSCNDPSSTGLVTSEVFQQLVLSLCPQLSHDELLHITKKFQDSANMVNYTALLKGLPPIQPVYRTGNDLATLLSHSPAPTVTLPYLSLPITSPPQHGLPGVKVKLQRKVCKQSLTHSLINPTVIRKMVRI